MKIYLEVGAVKPTRAHSTDAGIDLYAMHGQTVEAHGHATFLTGVHAQIPKGCAGLLVSKSGLNVRNDITSTGLIDEGYTGEITVKLYNHGDYDYEVQKGEKISQLVIIPVRYEDVEVVDFVDVLESGERGDRGFGSTGRM